VGVYERTDGDFLDDLDDPSTVDDLTCIGNDVQDVELGALTTKTPKRTRRQLLPVNPRKAKSLTTRSTSATPSTTCPTANESATNGTVYKNF
jgi:hypothetical protein